MKALWHFYLNFPVKFRLAILCICYSACIVATALAFQSDSPLIRHGSIVIFILLGGIFGWVNIWSIDLPLQLAVGHLQTMSHGDLSGMVTIRRNNELSKMLRAIKGLQEAMCGILLRVQDAGLQMEQSSFQIAEISREFSQASDVQHQRFEAVSTATGELRLISDSVRSLAESAHEKTVETENEAERGMRAVAENIEMMKQTVDEVNRAAGETAALQTVGENIHHIIGSITDIADQTNLLALNAAIEAARAGEPPIPATAASSNSATRRVSAGAWSGCARNSNGNSRGPAER